MRKTYDIYFGDQDFLVVVARNGTILEAQVYNKYLNDWIEISDVENWFKLRNTLKLQVQDRLDYLVMNEIQDLDLEIHEDKERAHA